MAKRNMCYVEIPNDKPYEISVYRSRYEPPLPRGHQWGPQVRDHYLFYHCTTGCGVLMLNGVPHRMKAGQYYFVPAGSVMLLCADEVDPWGYHYLILKGTRLPFYLEQMGVSVENPVVPCPESDVINACLDRLCVLDPDLSFAAEMERGALVCEMFSELIRTSNRKAPVASVQQEYIRRACQYLEENYPSKITTDRLASYLGLDRRYFSAIFKRCTGKSPLQYLHHLRMQKAQGLLAEPHMSVQRAASLVGLEYQTFCRLFKKQFYVTPSQFKKQRCSSK